LNPLQDLGWSAGVSELGEDFRRYEDFPVQGIQYVDSADQHQIIEGDVSATTTVI